MSTVTPMTVRWRLREILDDLASKGHPLSLNELSRRAGVSYPTVHAIAQGTSLRADLSTLNALCGALGVQTGDLLEYVPDDAGDAT